MAKVMVIGNSIEGFYSFRKELAEELKKNGHDVVLAFPEGTYTAFFDQQGYRMIDIQIERHGTNPLHELGLLRCFLQHIRKEKPDVVLTYTIKPNIYAGLLCRLLGVPYLANITGLGTALAGQGIKQRVLMMLYHLGIGKADCVFFQNTTNLERVTSTGRLKAVRLLPGSGVNLEQHCFEAYPEETEELVFLTIGRIMRDKGADEILEAARKVKQKYPKVGFCLIGSFDGDYQEKVMAAVEEGAVEFLGVQKDVHAFIKNSHATIHASYHEGMSNVLLETASAGRPVIATDVPGCRETYDAGVSGIACQAKNADDLARAILEFIELPHEQKAAMGAAGRAKIEREFNRKLVIQAYLEEIGKVIGER